MNEEPTKDLATRAFQKRVLDEFAATRGEIAGLGREVAGIRSEVDEIRAEQSSIRAEIAEMRAEQSAMRNDISEIRTEIVEIRTQQAAMARNIGSLDHRLSSLEERVDARLRETRPIWEAVQQQLRKLDQKLDLAIKDLFELRSDVAIHDKQIGNLEQRILAS